MAKGPVFFLLVFLSACSCFASNTRTRGVVERGRIEIGNDIVAGAWTVADGHLKPVEIIDEIANRKIPIQGEAFVLVIDGQTIGASDLHVVGDPVINRLSADPVSDRLVGRLEGCAISVKLRDSSENLELTWKVIVRDGTNYLRQELNLRAANAAIPLERITLIDWKLPGAVVEGSVRGSPVLAGNLFLGLEHPMSRSTADSGKVECSLERKVPLAIRQSFVCSSVIGIARDGQMRRDFLAYIELERARPYRPFLHYNSWFDLRAEKNFNEKTAIDAIDACGRELVQKRGVQLDSFLFDDGWDDPQTLWGFNGNFPNGFILLAKAAAHFGAAPGVWLSPFGGYGVAKEQRLACGRKLGYETNDRGFVLSGPKYFERFERICSEMLHQSNVNQFKFDGTTDSTTQFAGSRFGNDFEAAIQLINDLRSQKQDLYVNLTTGTWPSPFWLLFADSIWRGGADTEFAGAGSSRQQWITYRDAITFEKNVEKSPLFPLNSLMLHGIIYSRYAQRLNEDPGADWPAEVESFFGSGTQCQELYLTPTLLTGEQWDTLAEAARWARDNAQTLVDTHWVGGDPAKGAVYGWASWSGRKGILTLRNPADKAQSIDIDIERVFELPANAPRRYKGKSPWKAEQGIPAVELRGGFIHQFQLRPFQVITIEMLPDGGT